MELFPDVVKAVCQAYLVKRESCPLVETLIVSNAVTLVDPPTPDLLDSTSLQNVDWSKEQEADSTLARVVELVRLKFCPDKSSLQTESPNVLKYIREWSRLSLVDGVLYRNTTLNNVQTRQLVLPLHFRSIILKQLHDDLGHRGALGLFAVCDCGICCSYSLTIFEGITLLKTSIDVVTSYIFRKKGS